MPTPGPPRTYLPFTRISWGGTLGVGTPVESFSNSISHVPDAATPGVPTELQVQAALDAAVPSIKGWFIRPGSMISPVASLAWIKVNYIQANGKQLYPTTKVTYLSPTTPGVQGTPYITDFAQTYVLTERTAKPRGRAHSGRIFPPMAGKQPLTDGLCLAADCATMATSFGVLLNELNAAVYLGTPLVGHICVMSPQVGSGPAPTFQRVTGIVVDRVPDHHRSRLKKLGRKEGPLQPF